jgi:diguanylate cyclase (GGDEF)-like protein
MSPSTAKVGGRRSRRGRSVAITPPAAKPKDETTRETAYLIVLTGSNVGEMFKVERADVTVGRSAGADIRILDDGVSRLHCRIRASGEQPVVEDLDSRNGTFCNGERIISRVLKDGDKIQLGRTTILRFTYHDRVDESFQQQMLDSALRDGLTGAYNRRYFLDRVESELRFALRHRTSLSLLLLDLDHFKSVNDTHGHIVGDRVLRLFADCIHHSIRNEDVFARYGGEEFAIISRAISRADALRFAERLRTGVEMLGITDNEVTIAITCSIGVATIPDDGAQTTLQLIQIADDALYLAKTLGRNRVQEAQSDMIERGTGPG